MLAGQWVHRLHFNPFPLLYPPPPLHATPHHTIPGDGYNIGGMHMPYKSIQKGLEESGVAVPTVRVGPLGTHLHSVCSYSQQRFLRLRAHTCCPCIWCVLPRTTKRGRIQCVRQLKTLTHAHVMAHALCQVYFPQSKVPTDPQHPHEQVHVSSSPENTCWQCLYIGNINIIVRLAFLAR